MEMEPGTQTQQRTLSLPSQGAWMEIDVTANTYLSDAVAPFTGSVDGNAENDPDVRR